MIAMAAMIVDDVLEIFAKRKRKKSRSIDRQDKVSKQIKEQS